MDVRIEKGNIAKYNVDAIVYPTGLTLLCDSTIQKLAGPELQIACDKLGDCKTGEVKITPAFALPSKYIIHTVGPTWGDFVWNTTTMDKYRMLQSQLASCYENSLKLAIKYECESIAFPGIIGAYNYPLDLAINVSFETIENFFFELDEKTELKLKEIIFVCSSDKEYDYHIRVARIKKWM